MRLTDAFSKAKIKHAVDALAQAHLESRDIPLKDNAAKEALHGV